MNTQTQMPRQQVVQIVKRLQTTSAARVLSALGHPGYSEAWAARVLLDWIEMGGSLHPIVYATQPTEAQPKASLSVWKRQYGKS